MRSYLGKFYLTKYWHQHFHNHMLIVHTLRTQQHSLLARNPSNASTAPSMVSSRQSRHCHSGVYILNFNCTIVLLMIKGGEATGGDHPGRVLASCGKCAHEREQRINAGSWQQQQGWQGVGGDWQEQGPGSSQHTSTCRRAPSS